jgi:hypothetical protein
MVIEYISETSVRLKVENENNKITNKLRTIFFEDGCIPISQLEDYEEVPYAIWCNYLPELVPPTEVDRLNQKIKNLEEETIRLKNENALLTEILLENDYRIFQQIEALNNSQKTE